MRRAALLLAGLAAAAPAWGLWGSGAQAVKELQRQFDARQYQGIIAQLDPAGIAELDPSDRLGLRGESLRRGYALLAASYEQTGQPDQALSVYQVGTRLFPKDRELLGRLAVLLHRAGLEEQAQPIYEKLVGLDPASAFGHLGLAQIDHALGFLDRSADHYEKALQGMPERADVWREYGEDLRQARDYRTAELALRRSLELGPGDDAATESLALVLQAQGQTQAALEALEPLARAGRAGALRARSLWLLEAGRDREASAAAQALGSDPLALYVRARLALRAGRRAQALEALRLAAARDEAPFTAKVCAGLAGLLEKKP